MRRTRSQLKLHLSSNPSASGGGCWEQEGEWSVGDVPGRSVEGCLQGCDHSQLPRRQGLQHRPPHAPRVGPRRRRRTAAHLAGIDGEPIAGLRLGQPFGPLVQRHARHETSGAPAAGGQTGTAAPRPLARLRAAPGAGSRQDTRPPEEAAGPRRPQTAHANTAPGAGLTVRVQAQLRPKRSHRGKPRPLRPHPPSLTGYAMAEFSLDKSAATGAV
jgi:hypothetical protein